ncbi:MAG: peptidoglycan binding domain-containing protein [Oscillospiraceae bacterium]
MEKENLNQPDRSGGKASREEMARRISGSISARVNDEIRLREDARQSSAQGYGRLNRIENPYLRPEDGYRDYYAARQAAPDRARQTGGANKKKKKKSAAAKERALQKKKLRKKQRRKRILAGFVTFVILGALCSAGAFVWFKKGKADYDGIFLDNTYINGTDVSRKNVEEAAVLVKQNSKVPDVINFTTPETNSLRISLEDLDEKDNIEQEVKKIFAKQDHNGWFKAKTTPTDYSFDVEFEYDREKLYEEVDKKIVNNKNVTKPEDAYIERTSDGFVIVPEVYGSAVSNKKIDTLHDFIDGFLDREEYSINLLNSGCFKLPNVTAADLKEQAAKLNQLYSVEFKFDFIYTTETLTGSETLNWITFENDDPLEGFSVDREKVMAYVDNLADKYDTFGTDRSFHSTTRGNITVEQGEGDYGWWIDKEKTCNLIEELIHDGISARVEPYYYKSENSGYSYTCNPDVRTADDDIGKTYIEVDLKNQHLWYYKKGVLKHECDIVSGMPTVERNTPAGVYKLWFKDMNRVLRGSLSTGESWETPVTYWNNISTFGVGLHDATWHSSFGGDRYKTAGSHGCINMSFNDAKYVYENVELDTPVVMYW